MNTNPPTPILCPIANVKPLILRANQIESSHRLFRAGAKLYCLPPYSGGDGFEHLRVVALPKNSGRLIQTTIKARDACDYRLAMVYSPRITDLVGEWSRYNQETIEKYMRVWKQWGDMPYCCAIGSSEIKDRRKGTFVVN
jgi:hypothetical protein